MLLRKRRLAVLETSEKPKDNLIDGYPFSTIAQPANRNSPMQCSKLVLMLISLAISYMIKFRRKKRLYFHEMMKSRWQLQPVECHE